MKRTDYCGELRKEDIGREVVLMGWAAKERNLGSLIFIDLRDTTGLVQVVVREEDQENFQLASKVRNEYVLAVRGQVDERESKNPDLATGDIEIIVNEIKILAKSQTPPIYIKDGDDVQEQLKLRYRYLDLRKPEQQRYLKVRSKTAKAIRDFLDQERFWEIETPFLNKPTPEGARDYLVPSRVNPGKFYALPQSPQLMKQLLMIGGMDRYYQIVKCFRDEDLRANRQPEFTQVDIEMSFVGEEEVMELNERLMARVFQEVRGLDLDLPFARMTYQEAMETYGTDKPDLRFGFPLRDLTDLVRDSDFKVFSSNTGQGHSVRAINIGSYQDQFSRKDVDRLEKMVKGYGAKGLAWIRVKEGEVNSPIAKFLSPEEVEGILDTMEAGDQALILIVADKDELVFDCLAGLRNELASQLGLKDPNDFAFTWVVDFPLFEYDGEEDRFVAVHHPFTAPREEDRDLLASDPGRIYSKAYDLVCNGDELGGGSIRIHDGQLQEEVFKVLQLSEEEIEDKFGFLVEALAYGAPPHGGIAYGLDRLIMLLAGTDDIKDVIAFPKTQSASDLLTKAPSQVSPEQLAELHIKSDGRSE